MMKLVRSCHHDCRKQEEEIDPTCFIQGGTQSMPGRWHHREPIKDKDDVMAPRSPSRKESIKPRASRSLGLKPFIGSLEVSH